MGRRLLDLMRAVLPTDSALAAAAAGNESAGDEGECTDKTNGCVGVGAAEYGSAVASA